ncbi:hypothetical protein LMG1873_04972 [Achromobacter piechaudii]|uniref:Prolyl 4-hydroxylase alpha subunit domain-containing protein n=2 Tax=Achromobacter piechaudii TaxID=72556 RepID=A0ABM8L3V3_9BURK|nr:hypothetical protein LMG1873_04972 [Achromobacter piechaudii]CAB3912274.1 hypothetical protein LMG2828_05061 [Achromobacter piechaudii]CAB3954992.1 hypothetical protein LMG6103_04285 [Achromobacter piechaudii]
MLCHAHPTSHAMTPDPTPLEISPDVHRPLEHYDWNAIFQHLDAQGWALLPGFFTVPAARALARTAGPIALPALRLALYQRLLPLARAWAAALDLPASYPDDYTDWMQRNRDAGQHRALSAAGTLEQGGYQALMQHDQGQAVFPLQLIALLSDPEADFSGGEFVMTEQRPRMQSRPMVLPLRQGDAAIIAVSHRPVHGARGVYRVTTRQAISRVRSGQRAGLELLLHDGP